MKKTIIFLSLVVLSFSAFAQKKNKSEPIQFRINDGTTTSLNFNQPKTFKFYNGGVEIAFVDSSGNVEIKDSLAAIRVFLGNALPGKKLTFHPLQKTTLAVELKPEDWDVVLQLLNQSNAPHPQVSAAQQVLQQQLLPQFQQLQAQLQQKQIQDTTKRH